MQCMQAVMTTQLDRKGIEGERKEGSWGSTINEDIPRRYSEEGGRRRE